MIQFNARAVVAFALLLKVYDASAAIYYVAPPPVGNDFGGHTGPSEVQVFATIQHAAGLTNAGDTVLVRAGTYSNPSAQSDVVNISRSGTANGWITYANYPGEHPKLHYNGWDGFRIQGGNYIDIHGFEIQGNAGNVMLAYAKAHQSEFATTPLISGNGIAVQASTLSHHIRIHYNVTYENGCGGIGTVNADYVTIENNVVYNNAFWSPYACSGISNLINANFDNATTTKMVIRNNIVYGNEEFIPFHTTNPLKITDGNGIIIDTSRNNASGGTGIAYVGRTLISNNLVFDNGGCGIHAFESDHIDIVNNTVYLSGRSPAISDGEITVIYAGDVNVRNNILFARSGKPSNSVNAGSTASMDYNIVYNGTSYTGAGSHDLVGMDPKFVNPGTDPMTVNFHLQAASQAINSGGSALAPATDLDGVPRPYGAGIDRGAYEWGDRIFATNMGGPIGQ